MNVLTFHFERHLSSGAPDTVGGGAGDDVAVVVVGNLMDDEHVAGLAFHQLIVAKPSATRTI